MSSTLSDRSGQGGKKSPRQVGLTVGLATTPLIEALRRDLDQGEAETIVLALELSADLVLMDEREGRHAAQRLGLRTVGVVGILLDGKQQGYLSVIRPYLDALRTAGFYLSKPVYRRGLELAGELKDD